MQISKIEFSQAVLDLFGSQIFNFGLIETGGVLMGYVEGDTIFVKKASDGGPKAAHEEWYFRADPDYVDMFIDMEHANSNGKFRYLGEWHTHPQIEPEPSEIDLNSLEEIAESSSDFAILVIVGAIKYSINKHDQCSISILKHKEDGKFFELSLNTY